jgi:RHS repeat-associated protein
VVKYARYDQLGRLAQEQLCEDGQDACSSSIKSDVTYDALGRKSTASNPYRTTADSTYGIATVQYDALDRVTKTIPTDGTVTANNVTTAIIGNCSTVTDQAGKSRKRCRDALGRLIQVFEDPANFNYETDYQYDVLDNLIRVDQKGSSPGNSVNWRTRTFTYNSLSQVLSATNPESGTITYTYDDDGSVLTKVAPKPNQTGSLTVTTTYTYDSLHRVTQESFNDGSTPTVKFGYDGNALSGCTTSPPTLTNSNPKGHRTSMCDGSGATSWAQDAMGRVLQEKRTIQGSSAVTKTVTYGYNPDGSVATLAYPSGRMLTYTPDAAGRAVSAVDQNGTPSITTDDINYVTAATYAPQGDVAGMKYGVTAGFAGITHSNSYNQRLQPVTLSAASPSATILSLGYDSHLGTGNNGDVFQLVNNRDNARTQSFTYDVLNRIATAQSQATSGTNCWGNSYTMDAWGNLTAKTVTKCSAETLSTSATAQNQLTGFGYDAAGNMTSNGTATYTYDAENRITSTGGVTYTYDGDGNRVKKSNGKLYWTGLDSEPLTETDLAGTATADYIFFDSRRVARRDLPGGAVHYYFSDQLGSASVITNATGTMPPQEESDYYAYGGERPITTADPNPYKFTGKERDAESGLDYFVVRHYASTISRFMSADPLFGSPGDPQSLNRYAYVLNNPLRYTDPSGLEPQDGGDNRSTECTGRSGEAGGLCSNPVSPPTRDNSGNCKNDGTCGNEAQNPNEWSLSWQINASANFLVGELKGVADVTVAPVVNAVEHPIQTVEGIANAVEHPVDTAKAIANGAVDTVKAAANGDPRAFGQVVGTVAAVAYAAENVRPQSYPNAGGGGVNILNTPTTGSRIGLDVHGIPEAGGAVRPHIDITIKKPGIPSGPGSNLVNIKHWPW